MSPEATLSRETHTARRANSCRAPRQGKRGSHSRLIALYGGVGTYRPYENEIRSVEGAGARKSARLSIPPLHPLDQLYVLIVRLGRERVDAVFRKPPEVEHQHAKRQRHERSPEEHFAALRSLRPRGQRE